MTKFEIVETQSKLMKINNSDLRLVFAHLFCIFAPSNLKMYGKKPIKQVCMAGGYHQ